MGWVRTGFTTQLSLPCGTPRLCSSAHASCVSYKNVELCCESKTLRSSQALVSKEDGLANGSLKAGG